MRGAIGCGAIAVLTACSAPPSIATRFEAPAPAIPKSTSWTPARLDPDRKARFERLVPRLDALFADEQRASGAPGIAIAIVLGGETVYAKGFGLRDVERGAAFEADTPFYIASVTKGFTAMAILALRDAGKIELDAPAARYFPPIAKVKPVARDAPAITVRHLLNHASGMPEDNEWADVTEDLGEADLAKQLDGAETSRVPGIHFEYSNVGWAVLGRIVERVAGVPFEDYVRRAILEPLGMQRSSFFAKDFASGTIAVGYHGAAGAEDITAPRVIAKAETLGVMNAAGGLITSARDLARYVGFQVDAWPPRDDPESGPLRRSSVREMQQGMRSRNFNEYLGALTRRNPPFLAGHVDGRTRFRAPAYGFGLVADVTCEDDFQVGHGGGLPGYETSLTMLPDEGFGMIVLLNEERASSGAARKAMTLLREEGLFAKEKVTPAARLAAAPEVIDALLVHWDDERARALFEASFFRYATIVELKERFEKLGRDHGRCHLEHAPQIVNRLRGRFEERCDRGSLTIAIALGPGRAPKLQGMQLREDFAPSPALEHAAMVTATLLNRWDAKAAAAVLAKPDDGPAIAGTLAKLTGAFGACKLDRALESDGKTYGVFAFGCVERPLEITVAIDDVGRIARITGHAAPSPSSPNCAD